MKAKSRLAARVQFQRKIEGLAVGEVAARMRDRGHDWTEHTVIGVENDRRRLAGPELDDLLAILGVQDDWFPGGSLGATGQRYDTTSHGLVAAA